MDSDDDMYDSGYSEAADNDNDYAEDHTFMDKDTDGADVDAARHERSYSVLEEKDIRQCIRIHNDTEGVSTPISVSKAAASLLLGRYNWSVNGMQEAWFNDEEGVRKSVSLFDNPAGSYSVRTGGTRLFICFICFENYSIDSLKSTPGCCHLYCTTCWKGYISTSIDGGPGCLTLRCPDPSCSMAVGGDMIELLALSR
ncbi:hypothetical protein RJ639_027379 [Escallonia herrerae]|uniref:RING-type domain-containing protein n=1 Tax=Escallonia herrerae TaxID=1293975 RepID=A0AA89BJC6_9ASTE|nr:hypothetical protein RJ639_027379 [Escallonia herrerae]